MRSLRIVLLSLLVVAALVGGNAQAAGLNISGVLETKIIYTPESKFSGQGRVQFGLSTSSNKFSLSLAYYDSTKGLWESFPRNDSGTFYPYSVTLTASGAYWKNGPSATTKLGDFDMLGPNYIAGDSTWPPARQLRGVLVQDLTYQGLKLAGYLAWPKYSRYDLSPPVEAVQGTLIYGGSVNVANWRGVKVDLYGAVRRGDVPVLPLVVAPNQATAALSRINPTSAGASGELLLYTTKATTGPSAGSVWWTYVLLDENFRVTEIRPPSANNVVPAKPTEGGSYEYILAGHNYQDPVTHERNGPQNASWLLNNLAVGDTVQLLSPDGQPVNPDSISREPYSEAVLALEGRYKLAGIDISGQYGRQIVSDPRPRAYPFAPNSDFKAGFRTLTASTNLDSLDKAIATKPLSVTLSFWDVDRNFIPWASLKDADPSDGVYNPIYAQRDQRGVKLAASTAILPENPVDVSLTISSYITKSNGSSHNSSTLDLATKLAGLSLAASISPSSMSVSASRELGTMAGVFESLVPSVKITMPQGQLTKVEYGVKSKLTLGGFSGIEGSINHTTQGSSASTVLSAKYTAPNGITFEAKRTSPDNSGSSDDTFTKLSYSVSF